MADYPPNAGKNRPLGPRRHAFYDYVQWLPVTREIVLKHFGTDIGQIVMIYVVAMSEMDEAER